MEVTGAQSAYRILDLLTQIAMHPEGVSAADAARRAGLTLPTTHRLLRVLCDRGFAIQPNTGSKYRPGHQLRICAGEGVDHRLLTEIAQPTLTRLRDETGETVFLSVRDGAALSYLDCVASSHSVQMYGSAGMRVPLHATSQGKAILAFLPASTAEHLLGQLDYQRYTRNTIADAAGLLREIEAVRRSGYSVNLEERETGVRSVSAPVLDGNRTAVAAVCVGGPIFRVTEEDLRGPLARLVRAASQEISSRLADYAIARLAPAI